MKKNLVIGVVSPEFPPQLGGVQTYAWEMCRELVRQDCEVVVFTGNSNQPTPAMGNEAFRVEALLSHRRYHDKPLLKAWRDKIDVWHVTNAAYAWVALDFDRVVASIHGHDFLGPYFETGGIDLRRRLRLPWGHRPDLWINTWMTQRLMKKSLPHLAAVFPNSGVTGQRFLEAFPLVESSRLHVVHPGLTTALREESSPKQPAYPGAPIRLLTVTRLVESAKNVSAMLQAAAGLLKTQGLSPWQWDIVGDGALRPILEEEAVRLGLKDLVAFHGRVSDDELKRFFSEADLFVLTPREEVDSYEGFGIVFLEAAARGVPSLTTRVGGIPEAVAEGVSGFFADDSSSESILKALLTFFRKEHHFSPGLCRNHALSYSWEKAVARFVSIYRQLTEPNNG